MMWLVCERVFFFNYAFDRCDTHGDVDRAKRQRFTANARAKNKKERARKTCLPVGSAVMRRLVNPQDCDSVGRFAGLRLVHQDHGIHTGTFGVISSGNYIIRSIVRSLSLSPLSRRIRVCAFMKYVRRAYNDDARLSRGRRAVCPDYKGRAR